MNRDELLAALGEVAERLERQRASARIYIVGGAAMALAYDATRAARDIDALILDHHGLVTTAVQAVARERGLPSSWLNEQASAYMPAAPDRRQTVVFDHPALRVLAASPEHPLAMKARAARVADQADIVKLAGMVGATGVGDVERVVESLFPGEPLSERSRKVIEDILDSPAAGRD